MTTTSSDVIHLTVKDKIVVAEFSRGELKDEREILRLLKKLGEEVEKRNNVNLLLNMKQLTYVSSAGIGALVKLLKQTNRKNGKFKLCSLTPDVLEVIEVMNLNKIFALYDTEEDALKAF